MRFMSTSETGMEQDAKSRNEVSPQKAVQAYKVFGSYRKAAEVLGVGYQVVRKHVKESGIPVKPSGGSWLKGKKYIAGHRGGLARFLRDFPDVRLPHEYESIQALIKEKTGEEVSPDAIRCYIYRRRKAEKERMLSLPDLRSLPGTFRIEDERMIPFRSIESYHLSLNYHTFRYGISGKLRTGEEFTSVLSYADLEPSLKSAERIKA